MKKLTERAKKMGMAASQARLLSITARLTNNENTGQSISYSKQRLADQTQQITNEYNEALDATKLTVLTGFNGAQANYTDISYNLMTGLQMAEETKQYIVTDAKGKILVTNDIAKAYETSRGNYNVFLAALGNSIDSVTGDKKYSQADITVQKTYTDNVNFTDRTKEQEKAEQQIHEAWDRYFETVSPRPINLGDPEHDFGFSWTETYTLDENGNQVYNIGDGYAGYRKVKTDEDGNVAYHQVVEKNKDGSIVYTSEQDVNEDGTPKVNEKGEPVYKPSMIDKPIYINFATDENGNILRDNEGNPKYTEDGTGRPIYNPINYEGTSQESRDLYDYAMAITEAYLRVNTNDPKEVKFNKEFDLTDKNMKMASDNENAGALKYYRNIFDKMQSNGYFTYTDKAALAAKDEHYVYADVGTNGVAGNVQMSPLKDNYTFEAALKNGTLRLEYYSTSNKTFKSTTISEDNCIQEVRDERAIAKAESKYNQDMAYLENQDSKLDLELKKLDTEHSALQTEYDAVKNVVDKNVESSFKIFS